MFTGFLIVDKPKGVTSFDVVKSIRKLFPKGVKVGHTGTLDPLATGILILAVGKATKFSEYLLKQDKCYIVRGRFGFSSNTYDADGDLTEIPCQGITKEALLYTLEKFKGRIEQIPPSFSAIRVNGKRAYELARKGEKLDLKPREITVYSLKLLDFNYPDFALEVCCSSGTYIRSLTHDIGQALNCDAIVVKLRRIKVGNVTIKRAIPLSHITEKIVKEILIPVDKLLNMPDIEILATVENRFKNGAKVNVNAPTGLYKVYSNGKFLGVGSVKSNLLKPEKVLAL